MSSMYETSFTKRNLYDFNRRDGSTSSTTEVYEHRKELALKIGNEFINNNILIGRSLKIWERDLFDDANSFLISKFNFDTNIKNINFFSNSKSNFSSLYDLYYDKNLIINEFYEITKLKFIV